MGYEYDFVFDWMVKKNNPSQPIKSEAGEEQKKEENNDQAENNF